MGIRAKMKVNCVLCQKEFELFPFSSETYFAAPKKNNGISAYGCGSCGAVYCSECEKKAIKGGGWHGFDRVRCPKCAGAFAPVKFYVDRDLDSDEIQKTIKHLILQINSPTNDSKKSLPRMSEAFADLGEPGIEALLTQLNPSGKGVMLTGFSMAARILAKMNVRSAVNKLAAVLAGDPKSKFSLDPYRIESAEPLSQMDPEGSAKIFCEILVNEQEAMDLRLKSAELLGTLKREEAVSPLIQVLGNLKWSRSKLVATAAEALGKIGDNRSLEPLVASLKISDLEARARVADALGKLNDPRAIEPLKKNLTSSHKGLGEATARALKNLNWEPSDEDEKAVLAKALPVENERFCFSCHMPVGAGKSCPYCRTALFSKPQSPAMSSFLGYLFGGFMGGIALLLMTLVGAAMKYEIDSKIKMVIFGVFAISAWKGMKAKLSTPKDMAVLKPKGESGKSVVRGYLGLAPEDLDEKSAEEYDLKSTEGVAVGFVVPEGPADKAGIKPGDVIIMFNGEKIKNREHFRTLGEGIAPETKVQMIVFRNREEISIDVIFENPPQAN